MGLALISDDVLGLVERVQKGDPTIGWRGCSQMDVYENRARHEVRVVDFDITGKRYVAASVSTLFPGWRHELLRKLRDGDWRNDIDVANDHNDRLEAEAEYRLNQHLEEGAEKLAWALRRDVGAYHGGLTREFY